MCQLSWPSTAAFAGTRARPAADDDHPEARAARSTTNRAGPPVSVYTAGVGDVQVAGGGVAKEALAGSMRAVTRHASTWADAADWLPCVGSVSSGTVSVPPVTEAPAGNDV